MTQDFLVTFFVTCLVFTFVMCMSAVIKAIDLMSRGVSGMFILKVFSYNIPFIATFSIPVSVLTAVLLQFGRLSFDGELTAMKACGMSMWQITSPVIILTILLSGFCVYLNSSAAPRSHFAQRQVLVNLGIEEPVSLLEEGRFIRDFPGLMIYVGKKDKRQVQDVVVYEMGPSGIKRNVRAKSGTMQADKENHALLIDLYDVRIDQPDAEHPMDPTRTHYINAEHYPVKLDFSEMLNKGKLNLRTAEMTFTDLVRNIRDVRSAFPYLQPKDLVLQRMKMVVEFNERVTLSLSCFAFSLLGIPLGMKSRRKESSVGIAISLLLVFLYYFFVIVADSLVRHPQFRPDLIVWIPVVTAEVVGFLLIRRAN
jgi:lipopolysaccharide export system permease protein